MEKLEGLKVTVGEHGNRPLDTRFTTILDLAHRLEEEDIPYDLHRCWSGWQICFEHNGNHADIIEHDGSYGHENNLMESYGFEEDNGDVTGYLGIADAMTMIYNFMEL